MLSASQSPSTGPAVLAVYEADGGLLGDRRDAADSHVNYGSDEHQQPCITERENRWIWVLDPMTRKLRVPLHLLAPTQATATSGTVPSLCIAYLEGRCRHPWCRQAHVLPSAITQLRMEALNAPTCCHYHKAPHDISRLTSRFRYLRITNNGSSSNSELITTDRVASTVGLLRYLVQNVPSEKQPCLYSSNGGGDATASTTAAGARNRVINNGSASGKEQHEKENYSRASSSCGKDSDIVVTEEVLELPAKFICRLHLAHRCRYLEDCNNIHICREYESRLQPPPHILNTLCTVAATTRTVTLGDVCYTVTPLALGDVGDDDFAAIADAQRKRVQANGTTTVVSTPQWTVTTNTTPATAATTTTKHANELVYPAAMSLSTAAALAQANTSFLDGWAGVSTTTADTPSFALPPPPSYSPVVGAMPHGECCGTTLTGHLRVYDVCSSKLGHSHVTSKNGAATAIATTHASDTSSAVTRVIGKCKREQCVSSGTECGASLTSVPDNSLAVDEHK